METSDINSPPVPGLWTEPESAANTYYQPVYPYNNVQQTEAGHKLEMDDTPTRERVCLSHRTGTFIEMHPNGDEVHKVYGNGFTIIVSNKNVLIAGDCNIEIVGDCNIKVGKDMNVEVGGNYNLQVKGETNIRSIGNVDISGDTDVRITADENFGGTMYLGAADHISVASDLNVGGSIHADMINADSRVTALAGVYAGYDGFTTSGGLSVGFPTPASPVAIAGQIHCVGTINAAVAMNTPFLTAKLAEVGILDAVLMADKVNSSIFNAHIHPNGNQGAPTGTPVTPFNGAGV
jgi:hypothetical protein